MVDRSVYWERLNQLTQAFEKAGLGALLLYNAKGSIEPRKPADLILTDRDVFTISENNVKI